MYTHIPVLLNEVIEYIDPQPGQNFVDATLGGGGYSMALLEKNAPNGKVLSIDLDTSAVENFKILNLKSEILNRSTVVHGNFRDLDNIVTNHKFQNISGIVADLGLSSFELDEAGRGISFQKKEMLDMRFDPTGQTETAQTILNNRNEHELQAIFTEFGEEPFARLIARGIIRHRESKQITYTTELTEIITESVPRKVTHKAKDSWRRVFQALRIAVNGELESLEQFLPKALDLIVPGGKLAVVSFHSLEDRTVKQFFEKASRGCICPPEFPICICGKNPQAKVLTRKPVIAGTQELTNNPRSKSAKLRVLQKI